MLATRGTGASPWSVQVGAPFQHLLPAGGTGILHRIYPDLAVARSPRTRRLSVLRAEGEVLGRWTKRKWPAQIGSSANRGTSRFLQLGANIGPDVCGLSNRCNILHRAPEFGKQGRNYKSTRCMGVNSDDRSNEEEFLNPVLQTKHKIFLSHSGKQKEFVKDLCEDLEARFRFPFFDIHPSSLPKGEPFPKYIFQAARQCKMAVVVVSEEYFTSKWPMIELNTFVQARSRSNPDLKILPLFFGLSTSEFGSPSRRERWLKVWQGWAEEDGRVNTMDFQKALKEMGRFNGFEFCQDMREVRTFRRNVISSICNDISPDIKWDDSHVQGRANICEVVRKNIQGIQGLKMKNVSSSRRPLRNYKADVIGFYGVGGIGKTTMCKVLCNELSENFDGNVCHIELAINQSSEELLKEVLKSLTSTSETLLQRINEGECKHILRDNMSFQQKTFLAVDNVWDDTKSIEQAKMFLEAPFHGGSVILVTARCQYTLALLGIDACFEVPELGEDDARNLLLYHAPKGKQFVSKEDNYVIEECLRCCCFQKSEKQDFHYLPLALKILGLHLGCLSSNPSDWMKSLAKVRDFNYLSEEKNPVFSVIRLNYDRLPLQEQSLFMDIALYWPKRHRWNDDVIRKDLQDPIGLVEWLSLVHDQELEDTQIQLHRLKTKGLLENVDINSQEVSMHSLYRLFAELESQGKLNFTRFNSRSWVFENSRPKDLDKTPSGRCWENLIRVGVALPFWSRCTIVNLDKIQWRYCSNVVVLMLVGLASLKGVLNLKYLTCLRSLELGDLDELDGLEGLEELNNLTYFRWLGGPFRPITSVTHLGQLPASLEILQVSGGGVNVRSDVFARCTNLSEVTLHDVRAADGVDFGQCTSLRRVELRSIEGLENLLGLAPGSASSLQSLDISSCHDLSDFSGLDLLVGLQHLQLEDNCKLEKLPDLQNLTSLQVLRIGRARLTEVLGLGRLRQLRELRCHMLDIFELPNLSGLEQLHSLDLSDCSKLTTLEGVGHLPALRNLDLSGCTSLVSLKGLSKLTKLEELNLGETGIKLQEEDIHILAKLPMLRLVKIVDAVRFRLLIWELTYVRSDRVRLKMLDCLNNGNNLISEEELSVEDTFLTKYAVFAEDAFLAKYAVFAEDAFLAKYAVFAADTFLAKYAAFAEDVLSRDASSVHDALSKSIDAMLLTHAMSEKRNPTPKGGLRWTLLMAAALADPRFFRASLFVHAVVLCLARWFLEYCGLKEQDRLMKFIIYIYATDSPFQVLEKVERWVREHVGDSKLIRICSRFQTPLPLVRELNEYEEFAFLSRRKHVSPSFAEVRHVLNIAQVHAIAEKLSLITFDADGTIYADGHHIEGDNTMFGHIMKLMREGIQVVIVTAAGYSGNASKFEDRLAGLLEAFKELELPPHNRRLFHVMGGECNYLLRVNSDYRLEFVPDELWKSEDMLAWREDKVKDLLDNAERSLKSAAARLRVAIDIVRKPRAVGAVPKDPTMYYEVLEEMAHTVEGQLMQSGQPFCAFNGGNEVFVEVGNQSVGLRALMKYLNSTCSETLHVGGQSTVGDMHKWSKCSILGIENPEETALFARLLLRDIHLAKLK